MNFIFIFLLQNTCDTNNILLVCCVLNLTTIGNKMKKTLLLLAITSILVSCGNTKPDQVSQKSDDKLVCTSTRTIGSNMSTKNCRTVAEQKEERRKNQESMRNSRNSTSGSNSGAATIGN